MFNSINISKTSVEDIKKERRKFEESLRQDINLLTNNELYEEAQDLFFRLQQTMVKAMHKYLL